MTTAAAAAMPFPFASLEALTRAEISRGARLRRFARDVARLEALESALAELVDERVAIRVRQLRAFDPARATAEGIGVVLAQAGDLARTRRVLLEVEGALGAAISARAIRQRAPRLTDPARAPSPALAGAFAAVVVATLRRAHAGVPLTVLAAGPAAALARDLASATREVTTAWLTVQLGGDAYEARVSVPDALAVASPTPFSKNALVAMGDASIAVPIVIATTLAARADLAALFPGDAFVPDRCRVSVDAGGRVRGEVAIVPPRGELGIAAEVASDGRLVVRGRLESHPWERDMSSDESAATTTVEVLEDAPVVVRVELGTVEMKAREWAELVPGDVVTLDRKLGDLAILRVGGVAMARGELVQVEGELAVRIIARGGEGK